MPRTELCGRWYHIASDAVTVPAFCMALGRLLWTAVVLGLFLHLQYLLKDCSRPGFVEAFVAFSVAFFLVTALVELGIVAVSMQGSIVNTKARAGVAVLVVAHMVLGALQLLICALGIFILTDPTDMVMCASVAQQGKVDLIVALIAISQLADVSMKCCCHMILAGERVGEEPEAVEMMADVEAGGGGVRAVDEHPLRRRQWQGHDSSLQTFSQAEERWRGRCNFLCTCLKYTTCRLFSSSASAASGGAGAATAAAAVGAAVADGGGGAGMGMSDLEVVARVMADIFHSEGFLDVLPSDVMAAFILLRHVQKAREHEALARGQDPGPIMTLEEGIGPGAAARAAAEAAHDAGAVTGQRLQRRGGSTAETAEAAAAATAAVRVRFQSGHYLVKSALDKEDPEDRKVLEEGTYFEEYALAIYTWMMYIVVRTPCVALPALAARRAFHMPPGPRSHVHGEMGAIVGDNWARAHEAGLLEFTRSKSQDCELAYATFINSIYERPYAIFVDHKWQSVVLAIRGTLSLEDLLNDAHAEPVPMDEMGKAWGFDAEGEYCHGGMLNAADCIAKDLYRHQAGLLAILLHRLLQHGRVDSPPAQPTTPLTRSSKGYALRIVGHSLGAGAAILLSLMLRRDFPALRCLAYGTPGGLLSPKLAEATRAWTTTFIVGRDLVPRLSIDSVYALRDDLLRLLARCRANKNAVLRSVLEKDARAAVERLLHPPGQEPSSAFLAQLEAYEAQMAAVERRVRQAPLVPAGRLVHFVKSHEVTVPAGFFGVSRRKKQLYTPVWADPEDFRNIYVSSSMALDHLPDRMLVVMRETCAHMGIEV